MSNCPECDVINYGINPRCAACVRKIMGERIAELDAKVDALRQALAYRDQCIAELEAENKALDCALSTRELELKEMHQHYDALKVKYEALQEQGE